MKVLVYYIYLLYELVSRISSINSTIMIRSQGAIAIMILRNGAIIDFFQLVIRGHIFGPGGVDSPRWTRMFSIIQKPSLHEVEATNGWGPEWVFLTEASETKIGGKPRRVPPENFEKFVAEVHWKALTNCLIFNWFFSFPTSNEVLINLREISLAKPKTVESCGLRGFCGKGLLLVFFCIFCFFWGGQKKRGIHSHVEFWKNLREKKHLPRFSRKGFCWFQGLKSPQNATTTWFQRLLNSRKNQTPRFGEAIFSSGFNQPVFSNYARQSKWIMNIHDFSRIEVTIKSLCWLVVSTQLKNISQIGSFPQVGMKIKNNWNHHPEKNRAATSQRNKPSPSSMRGLVLLMDLAFFHHFTTGWTGAYRFLSGQTDFTGQNVELMFTNTWKTSCSRWFKPWPFYPLSGGHQQPLKGSLNYPRVRTMRAVRPSIKLHKIFFLWYCRNWRVFQPISSMFIPSKRPYMGGNPKIGVPQNGWFIMENPIKLDDLGVPLFSETSIYL